jgi:TRAP-type C4-dicarboxylate transport system permease small subunit
MGTSVSMSDLFCRSGRSEYWEGESMTGLLKKLLSFITATAMAGIVLVVFINVVMRYTLNSGLTWSEEIAVNLFVWVTFLGAILAALEGLHIKVDLLTSQFSKRTQKVFLVIANAFIIASMGVLITGGVTVVEVTQRNISAATGIPFSYISVSLVIFAVSIVLITICQTYTSLRADTAEDAK